MELYQLRSFAAVAELGQLTRAAEKLHISQPAVSAQIKALEDELGVALFERTSSGMVLTSAGRKLLPDAERIVAGAQALRSHARAIRGEVVGRARVGTVSDPQFVRIGDFLTQALEEYPMLEIEIHHEVTGAAFEKVRDGTLDASFYYGGLAHPDVTGVPLRDFGYRVVLPATWGDRVKQLSWDEIVAMPWIVAPPISTLRLLAEQLFEARGSSPVSARRSRQRGGDPFAGDRGRGRDADARGPGARCGRGGRSRALEQRAAGDDAAVPVPAAARARSGDPRAARRAASASGRRPPRPCARAADPHAAQCGERGDVADRR